MNRACKTAVSNLGANLTSKAIVRIGRCVGSVMHVTHQFDSESSIKPVTGTHADISLKDINLIVKELVEKLKVFDTIPGRKHDSFKCITGNLTEKLQQDELHQWMLQTLNRTHLLFHN